MKKFFLYIRKSTDEDDRQVLSLESQEFELNEFARREHLIVVETFRESQTAKCPGRPIFNQMLDRMERGEAEGILAWHPDRLARNSVDGGRIIFFIDSEHITALKFPTFWFEATPQGKFMLSIAFGQSKYFVDNLSENTKRGLRQKLRRGEWPGWAPLGYANDLVTHTIVKDKERFRLVRKIFELYATGNYSMKDIQNTAISIGLFGKSGKVLSVSLVQHTLCNPFYYGVFKYNGEMCQGKHEPMISKKLFDKCMAAMADKSRPKKPSKAVATFRGFLKCAECGCSITSEVKKGHIYYRCTKKKGICAQPYIREELLATQIDDIIKKVSLPPIWADEMLAKVEMEREQNVQNGLAFAQNLKREIEDLDKRLDTLLDTHLDGLIAKAEYVEKKQKILNHKIDVSEKLKDFEQTGNHRLEPLRLFILDSKQAEFIASGENFEDKKNFLKKIGSNPLLAQKALHFSPKKSWQILLNSWDSATSATRPRTACESNFGIYTNWLRG
ncbi:MAG: recombinase family protein [Candidatus Vogelbacteria bacterium]|nr:recombinase family protein [Candidatus Vogelbacteria bacterium]